MKQIRSGTLHEISWRDLCPWLPMLGAVRLATGVQVLTLAVAGLMATTIGWSVAGRIFLDETVLASDSRLARDASFLGHCPGDFGGSFFSASAEQGGVIAPMLASAPDDPAITVPYRLVLPFVRLFDRRTSWQGLGYYGLGGLWSLVVWSFFGAAIARIGALWFGLQERRPLRTTVFHAWQIWLRQVSAVLLPLGAVLLLASPLVILGWSMRFGLGIFLAGCLWLVASTLAIGITVLLLGLLFGWPITWGALAVERSDAFDAVSRTFSYLLQRPLHFLVYTTMAGLLGLLGWGFVWFFCESVIGLGYWGITWGAGADRVELFLALTGETDQRVVSAPGLAVAGGWLIHAVHGLLRSIAKGYSYGFFFSASTMVYLLLRFHADQTEMDEIRADVQMEDVYGRAKLDVRGGAGAAATELRVAAENSDPV